MRVNPYLTFNGRCEEAIEFYKSALGAKVEMLMRFKDAPDQSEITPGMDNKIMHAALTIGSTGIMASDGQCAGGSTTGFQGFSLTLTVANDAEAKQKFAALSEGGTVEMPLAQTFFATSFGEVRDRFGVSWLVIAEP